MDAATAVLRTYPGQKQPPQDVFLRQFVDGRGYFPLADA